MTEQANRKDWLERQLAQAREFLEEDSARLREQPDNFALSLSVRSWKQKVDRLQQEIRQTNCALLNEVVEFRLIGRRMDGSIPLKLLSKIADKINSAISLAAYHLRHGQSPKKGIPDEISSELDLRLSGLAFGSTKLVIAGNVTPDTTGESLMASALEQIFALLDSQSIYELRELVTVIGVPATRSLAAILCELDKQDIAVEIRWPSPDMKIFKWGGTIEDVRRAFEKLSTLKKIEPIQVTLSGSITMLSENGAIYIRTKDDRKVKISYSRQQYEHIRNYTLGMEVIIPVLEYTSHDELTDNTIHTYKLIS